MTRDCGAGKSHPLIRLGTAAAEAGYQVIYTSATKLATQLADGANQMTLTRTIVRYRRVDLPCINELGYMDLDRRRAQLQFQVLTERKERSSVAASRSRFSGFD